MTSKAKTRKPAAAEMFSPRELETAAELHNYARLLAEMARDDCFDKNDADARARKLGYLRVSSSVRGELRAAALGEKETL